MSQRAFISAYVISETALAKPVDTTDNWIVRGTCSFLVVAAAAVGFTACSTAPEFDVVISGGTVIDGTGAEPRRADVGIKGDRIVMIGNLTNRSASDRIDASGKTVTPGFIDIMGRSGVSLLANGLAESHLRQGITTELLVDRSPAFWTPTIADQDALRVAGVTFDWRGFTGYFEKLASRGTAINVGTIAALSFGNSDTNAFVEDAMRDGAWGVVDDGGLTADDLKRVATAVGRSNGVLMLPAGSPVLMNDDTFVAAAGAAHRIVITDLGGAAEGTQAAELNRRIARAVERNIAVYGTVIPSPEPLAGSLAAEALRYGGVMIATNSEGTTIGRRNSPAAFGAFPRLLGPMVRDEHLMDLKEAVRRSTSLPATAFNIPRRGILRENYFADVVVFDPSTIADGSTFEKPNQYPTGVEYVLVNGVVTSTPRGVTGARPGYGLLRNRAER
jgi:amidohydrolase family protein